MPRKTRAAVAAAKEEPEAAAPAEAKPKARKGRKSAAAAEEAEAAPAAAKQDVKATAAAAEESPVVEEPPAAAKPKKGKGRKSAAAEAAPAAAEADAKPTAAAAEAAPAAAEEAPAAAEPAEDVASANSGAQAESSASAVAADEEQDEAPAAQAESSAAGASAEPSEKLSMAERMAKMKELRKKMNDSTHANRRAVAAEVGRARSSARKDASNSRKLQKAAETLDERDMLERGEDPERARNWGYSIEQNEKWEDKLAATDVRRDKGDIDPNSAAERAYRRKVQGLKPDLASYSASRSGSSSSSSSMALVRSNAGTSSQIVRRADLDVNDGKLSYGGHKPDEAAVDRVISNLNLEASLRGKRSRKRDEDPDAEVNYINDRNKHFNAKVKRFYDDSTREIRENLERGTAL
ncbi:SYF2-domain-containing protein [Tilletiopsis washingtonensis]|uniref:Pre-mRNA-splicing factor SYF2 n=1 Tax=Tilletiopsis washingtonensis TaxID=58919 RepID=A0A316ZIB8_9BASI|nr:SYF2-domain-containing protein [Tilletiopsis washingtonensis]PWO01270.1 SYF2-domain-containing protein [Tilletiopsis washingtonensis]